MRHEFGDTIHSIHNPYTTHTLYTIYNMNQKRTTKLNLKIFKYEYEHTILKINQSKYIRWKCSKVTCTGKVTTNLHELMSYKL